jgi:hypothetical protein
MDTSELTICTDGLTECQINKGKELIQSYTDIMSQDLISCLWQWNICYQLVLPESLLSVVVHVHLWWCSCLVGDSRHTPHSILCELQPVHIQSIQKYEEEAESDMDTSELTICTDGLTECQITGWYGSFLSIYPEMTTSEFGWINIVFFSADLMTANLFCCLRKLRSLKVKHLKAI